MSGKVPGGIQWEDDDKDFGKTERGLGGSAPAEVADTGASPGGEDFAAMMAAAGKPKSARFMVGEKVKGTIVKIPVGNGDVLVDVGADKIAGIMDKHEVCDEAGNLKCKVGDEIETFVLAKRGDEVQLSFRNTQSLKSMADLESAHQRKLTIKGKVAKAVKGGFEIMVLGKTGFCPVSQIDLRFVENPEEWVGKELEFQIEKLERDGRNIVLSRSALLKARAEERMQELLRTLKPETILDGTVKELRDFGAFIDLGGVEGMVHVSEVAYARLAKPSDGLTIGQAVRVKVLRVENDAKGKPKIALSIKQALVDPWDEIDKHVEGGATYSGKVSNLMPFGAFVELKPGIEGLVHVSEMSWLKRVLHPNELLKIGDHITVVVKDIDRSAKRISLSMKALEADPWSAVSQRLGVGAVVKAPVERLKSFGATVILGDGITGMLPINVIKKKFGEAYRASCTPGKELEVKVIQLDKGARKIRLSLVGVDEDDAADRSDYLEYLKAEQEKTAPATAAVDPNRMGSLGALLNARMTEKKDR